MTGTPAYPSRYIKHIGVICGRGITPNQRERLARQLRLITSQHPGRQLILHHGCGREADEVAHQTVRALSGWRIYGHPAGESASGEVMFRAGVLKGLSRIFGSKSPALRDADIVDAAQILIVVMGHGSQPDIDAAVKRAQSSRRQIINLEESAKAYTPPTPNLQSAGRATRSRPVSKSPQAVAGARDRVWAERQGREDKAAGKACGRYTRFRVVYGLVESGASLKLWHAYRAQAKSARTVTVLEQKTKDAPRRESRSSRASGIPLGRAAASRGQAGPGYDRTSDLSPRNAAMLKELNQQDTLVDMWR